MSLATLDGHVYEVGDTRVPFTIQSHQAGFQRLENDRRMDRRALERARLLSARCRHRMGRGPTGLSLWRRHRLSRDH
ncbi:MAG: hypothetical protein Q8L13_11185 [Bradyrhizobium sp.]|nr:hypothetical protein [Bradyrhizobium sp.]MDP1866889.1 hypothetical protein [Bradyrhizobium sp.]